MLIDRRWRVFEREWRIRLDIGRRFFGIVVWTAKKPLHLREPLINTWIGR